MTSKGHGSVTHYLNRNVFPELLGLVASNVKPSRRQWQGGKGGYGAKSSDDASADAAEACGSFVSQMWLPAGDAAASPSHGCAIEQVIFWVMLTHQRYGDLLVEFEP